MNKKEILIKALRGSVAQLNELSTMTEGIDVYNATGHVDTEFLIEALSCVNTFMDASNTVVQKISSLLAPDAPTDEKKKQADEGKKWNVEDILKHCTLEDSVLKLPKVQLIKNPMLKPRSGLRKPAVPGKVGKYRVLHSRSIRRGCFQSLKKGSDAIFSRNTSSLKHRLR